MFLTIYPKDKKLVSIMTACEITGVSRRTIYNWIQANKVDWYRLTSGSIRIVEDSLFSFVDTPIQKSNFEK